MTTLVKYDQSRMTLEKSLNSWNLRALLGIMLLALPCTQCWLMPWPGSPLRQRRQAMTPLARTLDVIASHPVNTHRPAVTSLRRKMTSSEMEEMLSGVEHLKKYPLDPLYQLYSTTGGTNYIPNSLDLASFQLLPNYVLLPLPSALEIYQALSRGEADDNMESNHLTSSSRDVTTTYFDESWFPVMTSGESDFIFINLTDGSVFEYKQKSDCLKHVCEKYNNLLGFFQYQARLFTEQKVKVHQGSLVNVDAATRAEIPKTRPNSRDTGMRALVEKFRNLREIMDRMNND